MRIDPQRLIRLAVLIKSGSFKRAADQLGVTQPALSQSIAHMEDEVGVELIKRTRRGIEPTVYGQVLYERARTIDHELTQAAQQIRELAFGNKGVLTVGSTVGGAGSLVALALCKLLNSHPAASIKILESSSVRSLLARLNERTIDLLICQQPNQFELAGARPISLLRAERVACVRTGHPLSRKATLSDFGPYPFICPPEEMGLLLGFQQIFRSAGLELPEIIFSDSIQIAKEMVLNSNAFALFSDLSVLHERRLGSMRTVGLAAPTQYWMQLIIRPEQIPTDLMKSFVASILSVCGELKIDVHPDISKSPHFR
ncbi:LysR family transcriptional regulator [Lichenicoccus sp.]|uniref:LysR family transcriptional regulator n=1 Tax=Lichenicoccus sp. TaxID=2781899 RepID=UPI003D1211A1